jgi:hypothetical protein
MRCTMLGILHCQRRNFDEAVALETLVNLGRAQSAAGNQYDAETNIGGGYSVGLARARLCFEQSRDVDGDPPRHSRPSLRTKMRVN